MHNLTEGERDAVKQFLKIWSDEFDGLPEDLGGNGSENDIANAAFSMITYIMADPWSYPSGHKHQHFNHVMSKMNPYKVQILKNLITSILNRNGRKFMLTSYNNNWDIIDTEQPSKSYKNIPLHTIKISETGKLDREDYLNGKVTAPDIVRSTNNIMLFKKDPISMGKLLRKKKTTTKPKRKTCRCKK